MRNGQIINDAEGIAVFNGKNYNIQDWHKYDDLKKLDKNSHIKNGWKFCYTYNSDCDVVIKLKKSKNGNTLMIAVLGVLGGKVSEYEV